MKTTESPSLSERLAKMSASLQSATAALQEEDAHENVWLKKMRDKFNSGGEALNGAVKGVYDT